MPRQPKTFTIDDVRRLASTQGGSIAFTLRTCGACQEPLPYLFGDNQVNFNSTCGCSHHSSPNQPRSFEEGLEFLNGITDPKELERVDHFIEKAPPLPPAPTTRPAGWAELFAASTPWPEGKAITVDDPEIVAFGVCTPVVSRNGQDPMHWLSLRQTVIFWREDKLWRLTLRLWPVNG